MPSFSASLQLPVRAASLKDLYPHADEHWERPHLDSEDAMRLLQPIADRLEVRPSAAEVKDMGRNPRPPPGSQPTQLVQLTRHQGFRLRLRLKVGVGRCDKDNSGHGEVLGEEEQKTPALTAVFIALPPSASSASRAAQRLRPGRSRAAPFSQALASIRCSPHGHLPRVWATRASSRAPLQPSHFGGARAAPLHHPASHAS